MVDCWELLSEVKSHSMSSSLPSSLVSIAINLKVLSTLGLLGRVSRTYRLLMVSGGGSAGLYNRVTHRDRCFNGFFDGDILLSFFCRHLVCWQGTTTSTAAKGHILDGLSLGSGKHLLTAPATQFDGVLPAGGGIRFHFLLSFRFASYSSFDSCKKSPPALFF